MSFPRQEVAMHIVCKTLVAAAIVALAGCASTSRSGLAAVSDEAKSDANAVDLKYVESIERASRKAGVRVVWINPPRNVDRGD